jgi:uncharacterized DUF497 family protein
LNGTQARRGRIDESTALSFEMARSAFEDPDAFVDHERIEGGERRWQTIGMVEGVLLLLVAHTVEFEADGEEIIRIISARRADREERRRYEKSRQENLGC